jgi:molybdopterin molybdotransferase
MEKRLSLGLKEALKLTLERIKPLAMENVELVGSVDRAAAADLYALVDSPPIDASMKDGYALLSSDVADASAEEPVWLRLAGNLAAGGDENIHITPGTTVRIMTGARLPTGADAVVAEEFATRVDNDVLIEASSRGHGGGINT